MTAWFASDLHLDPSTPEIAERFQRFLAGPWRYERLDGVGHWMQLEAPDAVNSLLVGHLAD